MSGRGPAQLTGSALAGEIYGSLAAVCELSGVPYAQLRAWRDSLDLRTYDLHAVGHSGDHRAVYLLSDVLALRRGKEQATHGPAD